MRCKVAHLRNGSGTVTDHQALLHAARPLGTTCPGRRTSHSESIESGSLYSKTVSSTDIKQKFWPSSSEPRFTWEHPTPTPYMYVLHSTVHAICRITCARKAHSLDLEWHHINLLKTLWEACSDNPTRKFRPTLFVHERPITYCAESTASNIPISRMPIARRMRLAGFCGSAIYSREPIMLS